MPTTTYTQRCLTCNHPVNTAADNVGLIKMANQPRYYHRDSEGCQEAERNARVFPDVKAWEESWNGIQGRQRQKNEREYMVVAE